MRVALITGPANSAVDQVMTILARGLAEHDIEAVLFPTTEICPGTYEGFDLVHYSFYRFLRTSYEEILPPITVNVWGFSIKTMEMGINWIRQYDIARLFVDDTMTLQILGQSGYTNVTQAALLFDPGKFRPLPAPDAPFTVGVFGNDYYDGSKRFAIAEAACERAGVVYYPMIMDPSRTVYTVDPIEDVYSRVHVLAHCSFIDTNSLPCLEALACGRPILTIRNYGLGRVLHDGVNGLWYDGSVHDLADAIKRARDNYESLAAGARATVFPDNAASVAIYAETFRRIVAEYDEVQAVGETV
jgi:glycosyl transferase family 1